MFFNNQQHQIERAIAAFLSLFNNITILKKTTTNTWEPMVVDMRYGPTDKFKAIGEEKVIDEKIDPKYMTHQTNPRISIEMTDLALNYENHLPKNTHLQFLENDTPKAQENGVPITLSFSLYSRTSNQKDAFAITEQIVPFFNPHITMKIKTDIFPFPIESIVTLTGVSFEDNYEGDFSDTREVIMTFTFEMTYTLYLKGKVKDDSINTPCTIDLGPYIGDNIPYIEKVITNIHTVEVNFFNEENKDETITVTPIPKHPFSKENIKDYETEID